MRRTVRWVACRPPQSRSLDARSARRCPERRRGRARMRRPRRHSLRVASSRTLSPDASQPRPEHARSRLSPPMEVRNRPRQQEIGGPQRSSQRTADFRSPDTPPIGDGNFHDAATGARNLREHLNGPSVGHLTHVQPAKELSMDDAKRAQIVQREPIESIDQTCDDAISQRRMPRHRSALHAAVQTTAYGEIRLPANEGLEETIQLLRMVAEVPIEESDDLGALSQRVLGSRQASATVAPALLAQNDCP